jgi:hypothetical protein
MIEKKLPECLLIGAAKSGTTSLAYYLSQNPEVSVAKGKEAHFFDSDERYARGVDYYRKQFFGEGECSRFWIDATPGYMHVYFKAIDRIKETYGEQVPKFLVVVRDPVKRSWSHYLHRLRNSQEQLSFENALKCEKKRIEDDPGEWWRYFSDSLYGKQLNEWFSAFGPENFLVIKQSDLLEDPVGQTNAALAFIGCSKGVEDLDAERRNTATLARFSWFNKLLNMSWPIPLIIKRKLLKETGPRIRQKLRKLNQTQVTHKEGVSVPGDAFMLELRSKFRSDIELLESITGRSFEEWK